MTNQSHVRSADNSLASEALAMRFFAALLALELQKEYLECGPLNPMKRHALGKFASEAIDKWVETVHQTDIKRERDRLENRVYLA